MIVVKCSMGEFTLDKGRFIKGKKVFKGLYDAAMVLPLTPQEGPADYAIAAKMMGSIKWEVVDFDFPEPEANASY